MIIDTEQILEDRAYFRDEVRELGNKIDVLKAALYDISIKFPEAAKDAIAAGAAPMPPRPKIVLTMEEYNMSKALGVDPIDYAIAIGRDISSPP